MRRGLKALQLSRSGQFILSIMDISRILGISIESARVTASRYVKKGVLVRLKRDMYLTMEQFRALETRDRFRIANLLQTPSYISLTTALGYWNVSTQQQQDYIESVALKRTKTVEIQSFIFSFSLIKETCYNGFEQRDGFFIATAEKALADVVYLASLGRYKPDMEAVNLERVDMKKTAGFINQAGRITQTYWNKICERFAN